MAIQLHIFHYSEELICRVKNNFYYNSPLYILLGLCQLITSWLFLLATFAQFTCFQGAHLTAYIKAFNRKVTRLCSLQQNIGLRFLLFVGMINDLQNGHNTNKKNYIFKCTFLQNGLFS